MKGPDWWEHGDPLRTAERLFHRWRLGEREANRRALGYLQWQIYRDNKKQEGRPIVKPAWISLSLWSWYMFWLRCVWARRLGDYGDYYWQEHIADFRRQAKEAKERYRRASVEWERQRKENQEAWRRMQEYFARQEKEEQEQRERRGKRERERAKEQEDTGEPWGLKGDAAYRRAVEIMGLGGGFAKADMNRRYRALQAALHPDKGGSPYFAKQLNWARDVIVRRHGW